MSSESIKFDVPKREADRLNNLALSYGLSLGEFFKKLSAKVSNSIGLESWSDYSPATKTSFKNALADFKAGKTSSSL